MARKLWTLFAAFVLMGAVLAQTAAAQDAKAVLQAATAAMGADKLKSVQYSGSGWYGAVGQNHGGITGYIFAESDDWPETDVQSFSRTIDYDSKSLKEEMVRVQGKHPPRGGGLGFPIVGELRSNSMVSDKYAWTMQGNNVVPQPADAELQQFEIWVTPHGFLKAAMTGNPTLSVRYFEDAPGAGAATNARKVNVIGFTAMGKYRVTGEFNDQNMLERVITWIPSPVMGDMQWEIRYSQYKDFGGIKFPMHIHMHRGDHPLIPRLGMNYLDISVSDAKMNVPNAAQVVPDAARKATIPPVRVDVQKLADGVWFMGGGSHNSVVVEFKDFVAVVEAPLNEERSLAVIAEINKLVPNKKIKYVVNTHHHWDHLGGVRTYVAQGATVITHESNRQFYRDIVFSPQPRTLMPDSLSLFPPATTGPIPNYFETMTQKYALSDGTRSMLMHAFRTNHVGYMMVAYLPKEKILVEADLYTPAAEGQQPAPPNPNSIALYRQIKTLKLDVDTIAPLHGRVGTMAEFEKIVGAAANQRGGGGGGE